MTPENREPTHPGQILLHEFLKPKHIPQIKLAQAMGIPIQLINTIVKGKRSISPRTAILLSRELGSTPQFWLHLQVEYDLYKAKQKMSKSKEPRE